MKLELFGAIALTTFAAAACSSDDSTLGQGSTDTGGAYGAGGALGGTGASTTGNGGSGIAGSGTGMGGSQTGAGGNQIGAGGNQTGAGGNQAGAGGNQTGAGGTTTITCPTTQPTDGDTCGGRTPQGGCTYGSMNCRCVRQGGGTTRAWACFDTSGDGGFTFPPRDGGFAIPDGGFTQPTACTQGSDCSTGGNVCCQLRRGMICLSSANCTQFGGTPVP